MVAGCNDKAFCLLWDNNQKHVPWITCVKQDIFHTCDSDTSHFFHHFPLLSKSTGWFMRLIISKCDVLWLVTNGNHTMTHHASSLVAADPTLSVGNVDTPTAEGDCDSPVCLSLVVSAHPCPLSLSSPLYPLIWEFWQSATASSRHWSVSLPLISTLGDTRIHCDGQMVQGGQRKIRTLFIESTVCRLMSILVQCWFLFSALLMQLLSISVPLFLHSVRQCGRNQISRAVSHHLH